MARAIVVVPTYNERDNIELLARRILSQDPRLEVLVVDDDSPDGTADVARDLSAAESRVHLLVRRQNRGYANAVRDGMRRALEMGAQWVLQMDADFSHDPDRLPALLAMADECDVVIGSRYIPGGGTRNWGWHRRLLSGGANRFARLMLGISIHDATGGFRCYRREAIPAAGILALRTQGYAFQIASIFQCQQRGLKLGEVPIIFADRTMGRSKLSKLIIVEALLLVCRLAWHRVCANFRRGRSGR